MQKKFSFDKATLVKMGKGALISGVGAVALYFLGTVGTLQISDPFVTSLVAWAVPTFTNAVKEWMKGV